MTINPAALLSHRFGDISHNYTERDAILYALGVGLGRDPLDSDDLAFLLEDCLQVLPTYAVTLCTPGMWIRAPEFGVDYSKLVHFEQAATFHAPLPRAAEVVGKARIVSLTDRGEGRGAVVILEREIRDAKAGTVYCTLQQTALMRADGGFGGPATPVTPSIIPERQPDARASFSSDIRAALIYRLSGDWNPLHSHPEAARLGGFDRPILHGLASYAIAGVAISRALSASPARVGGLRCRFSGIVFPGDTIDFKIWRDGDGAAFQGFVGERKVMDQGFLTLRAAL